MMRLHRLSIKLNCKIEKVGCTGGKVAHPNLEISNLEFSDYKCNINPQHVIIVILVTKYPRSQFRISGLPLQH